MGKFRSKLKGQTKGKRWPKGQSSSSNPETKKHRDLAKGRFFQENLGSSSLTFDALRRHDAIQPIPAGHSEPKDVQMEEGDQVEPSSIGSYSASSYETMQSFASEWSDCSNISFGKFLRTFRSDSVLHKEMLAMLAAITDVIKEKGGSETPTEYYCALLTTLEQIYKGTETRNEDQLTAVLCLLNIGMKSVPEAVIRSQFTNICKEMLHILHEYSESENNSIIKSLLLILGTLLRKQELAAWQHEFTNAVFRNVLTFSIHMKPKWRKTAQSVVVDVIKSDYFVDSSVNFAADRLAEFCEQNLDACMGGNDGAVLVSTVQAGQTTILHVLGLMKQVICNFSKHHIKECSERILRLMTLNYPLVTSCGLQVLHSLFSSQSAVISSKLNVQLIAALYDYQPGAGDVQPSLAWLAVMQQAHVHLADVDLAMACNALPRIFATCTQLWLSEKPQIITAVTHTLEVLLKDCLGPACFTEELAHQHNSKISKCFGLIESALSYQYHKIWHQVLYLTGIMFEIGGRTCPQMLMNCLRTLAELRDSYNFSFSNELEHAVGAAIRFMGPEQVLSVITLKNENGDLNIDRSWMLPVLKENVKGSTLEFFIKGILPLALYCQRRSTQLAEMNDGIGSHSSELLYMQLWNLLPSFCNSPTDIKDSFKSVAKVIGTAISDRKELRLSVMASLRKLIASAKASPDTSQQDIAELARFDKNYLPILFNVYTTKPIGSDEEGQRLAALDTIKVYATIASPELSRQLLSNAIERLNSSSDDPEDSFIKESILDLIRVLVPYQDVANVRLLYDQCVKALPEIKNHKEQKKAYRLLEEICSSQSPECQTFVRSHRKEIQSLLKKSLENATVPSKGARLRCMNYLVKSQPHLDRDSKLMRWVIPETVLSCKDNNENTRRIAYEVLNTVGETFQRHNQLDDYVKTVASGLVGTVQMKCCTVLALASMLHNFSGGLGQENVRSVLDAILTLMGSHTREIVGSCLSFLKVYIKIIPSPVVATSIPLLMEALCKMPKDCRGHFRQPVKQILDKLIRKFGHDTLQLHVPPQDAIMLKILKNLKKMQNRKRNQEENKSDSDENEEEEDFTVRPKLNSVDQILADSDSDLDDMETDQPKVTKSKSKKVSQTWIEEAPETIVDFTDRKVMSKIAATKPGVSNSQQAPNVGASNKKGRGFKTAPDGRLIIADDSSDSETEGDLKPQLFNSDNSDDDDKKSVAETLLLRDRKRKRASSVKSGVSSASQPPIKYKTGGVGIHRKKNKAAGQFKNIIKAARKGTLKGVKAKK